MRGLVDLSRTSNPEDAAFFYFTFKQSSVANRRPSPLPEPFLSVFLLVWRRNSYLLLFLTLSPHLTNDPAVHTKTQHHSCLIVPRHFSNLAGVFGHRAILIWGYRGMAGRFLLLYSLFLPVTLYWRAHAHLKGFFWSSSSIDPPSQPTVSRSPFPDGLQLHASISRSTFGLILHFLDPTCLTTFKSMLVLHRGLSTSPIYFSLVFCFDTTSSPHYFGQR